MNAYLHGLAGLVVGGGLLVGAGRADLIWQESFADVSDWNVIFNAQSDASSLTSDGALGLFFVEVPNNEVAFGPTIGVAPFVTFNPANAADYSMVLIVDSLTSSVSYDVRLDQFDAADAYLGTVFGVVPQGTSTGTDTINLGGFTFDGAAAKLLPKISVFTGPDFGNQTVRFDELRFEVVPEPASALLLLLGASVVWRRRPRAG